MPEDVSCIIQVVSEYLKDPCPITSLSESQGPTHPEGLKRPQGDVDGGNGRREAQQVRSADDWLMEVLNEYRNHT